MTKLKQRQYCRAAPTQNKSLAYQCYQAFLCNSPNRYKLLDKLKRYGVAEANELSDKTIYLSEKAKKILRVVLQMIFRSNKAVVNQKYLNKITKCCDRQNRRLLNELLNSIQYEKIKVWKGKKFSYYFCIKLSASLQEEIRDTELENSNFTRTKMSDLICNNRDSNKLESRSNAHTHESKFLNNSNSNNISVEQVENIESNDPTTETIETVPLAGKRKFISGKRKKATKAQRAARVYKMPPQYDKPKSLGDHYPLSQEDCYDLQKRSSKGYNLNVMNEILLDMSRKPELQSHSFVSKAKFMAYMTKAYREEGRDVDKANSPTFKIIKRRPKAEVTEIITLAERERYLNETENAGIYSRCDYTQLRAKIAGGFPLNLGYDLLKNMINVKKNDSVFEITMHTEIELTEHYKQLLLNNVNAVGGYSGVEELDLKKLS